MAEGYTKKIFEILFPIMLVASVFFWVLQYVSSIFGNFYYLSIAFLAIVLPFISHKFSDKISFLGIAIFGLYMSFISILGIFVSGNPLHAVQISVYFFGPMVFFLFGYNSSPVYIRNILILVLLVVFLFTFFERLEFWLGYNALNLTDLSTKIKYAAISDSRDPAIGRATGVFVNPNQLGFFAGCVMFSIFSLSRGRSSSAMLIFLASAIIIFFSGSRGSIFAFVLASLAYALSARSAKVSIGIFFTSFVIYIIYYYLTAHGSSNLDAFLYRLFFDSGFEGDSMSERVYFWSNVFDRVNILTGTLEPPELALGHAIDSFYMRLIAQAGIFGALLSAFLFIAQYLQARFMPIDLPRAEFRSLLVFIIVNSVSMLGILGLEAVFVWAVFGAVARRAGRTRTNFTRTAPA